jgi:MFS family permease
MSIVARFLNSIDTATVLATASAVMIIAFQVAGKAVRDAFFLSNYDVTLLPVMLVAASAFSIVTVLLTGRAMSSLTPARFVPLAFLSSALLLLAEWQLSQGFPKVASVAVYFHIAALGGVLVSGFWSIVNERFDPRTAKKRVSWIGAGGAMGGLLGGVLAERVGASLSLSSMFPILSLIHLLCAGLLIGLSLPEIGRRHSERPTRKESSTTTLSGLQTLKSVPYLRNLALLVFLGTASAACIDYVFKTQTVNTYQQGEALMRFFAIFYTATGVLTFLVQISFSRLSLEKLGLGKTAAARPAVLALGGVAALAVPGLAGVAVARGLEAILRNSLFRSAYELFFTPLPETEKRSTKSMIDVGSERLGDIEEVNQINDRCGIGTIGRYRRRCRGWLDSHNRPAGRELTDPDLGNRQCLGRHLGGQSPPAGLCLHLGTKSVESGRRSGAVASRRSDHSSHAGPNHGGNELERPAAISTIPADRKDRFHRCPGTSGSAKGYPWGKTSRLSRDPGFRQSRSDQTDSGPGTA